MSYEPLPFIRAFLSDLDRSLANEGKGLSCIQRGWIAFCLMGILLTNSICWAKFERMSFRAYTKRGLSWMFRHSKIPWDKLLENSIRVILHRYGIKRGFIVIDDKDISRSKNAKKIHLLHKMKDKKTGGYLLGQNIVCTYFVTEKVSIPVGFAFYAPDPNQKEWRDKIKDLKKKKIGKSLWPKKPEALSEYPKKYELGIQLCREFQQAFPEIKIKAVLADNLYGHLPFILGIQELWAGIQIITKMRKNQKIRYWKKECSCGNHFSSYAGWKQEAVIRGRDNRKLIAGGGRLYVPSHKAKRFVIAVKYEGEKEYRYLMATNLSWNMKEVIEAFSIRWLIEVFFEDWSGYNGFCSLAKQCGEEGSLRPLILSYLFDHCFLYHEDQHAFLTNKQPLATFGSLIEKSRAQALFHFIQEILEDESPKEKLNNLISNLDEIYPLQPSKKHMVDVNEKGFMNKVA